VVGMARFAGQNTILWSIADLFKIDCRLKYNVQTIIMKWVFHAEAIVSTHMNIYLREVLLGAFPPVFCVNFRNVSRSTVWYYRSRNYRFYNVWCLLFEFEFN
jgi:hypothetical protein